MTPRRYPSQILLGTLLIPTTAFSATGDLQGSRALANLLALQTPTYRVECLDPEISERWPQPSYFLIKRNFSAGAFTVKLAWSGTATRGTDYRTSHGTTATVPDGVDEVLVTVTPIRDRSTENNESVTLTLSDYNSNATGQIVDAAQGPSESEATRFLVQAAFGADGATLKEVQQMDFDRWILDQFSRPLGRTAPILQEMRQRGEPIYHTATKMAIWQQVMRSPSRGPRSRMPDPLRQRVAYSLSQIFVVSQKLDTLGNNSDGVASYYDTLLTHSFGNYRDLLKAVCLHPCMGLYLSHLGNRKADPSKGRFPDENFAREVMQLFSIGLWELNPDGTRKLRNGQPIPTYDNTNIREYARAFTGYQYGGTQNTQFKWAKQNFVDPMKLWDSEHDLEPKTFLSGVVTPKRTASSPDRGLAAMADLDAAVDSLYLHPNVGPFLGRLLIQRFTTSNPSPAYIRRVATAFNDNGRGVRGDMRAVIRAILLDPEARTFPTVTAKKREPYLTLMQLAKTFDAQPVSGRYPSATYMYDFMLQEPFESPSVFNFYQPAYRPSGEMTDQNQNGPEFQIMTAVTAHDHLNITRKFIHEHLARWGADANDQIKMKLNDYMAMADKPDQMVHRLANRVLDRRLNPVSSRIIRQAVGQIPTNKSNWQRDRVHMALYLICACAEFQVQR